MIMTENHQPPIANARRPTVARPGNARMFKAGCWLAGIANA